MAAAHINIRKRQGSCILSEWAARNQASDMGGHWKITDAAETGDRVKMRKRIRDTDPTRYVANLRKGFYRIELP